MNNILIKDCVICKTLFETSSKVSKCCSIYCIAIYLKYSNPIKICNKCSLEFNALRSSQVKCNTCIRKRKTMRKKKEVLTNGS